MPRSLSLLFYCFFGALCASFVSSLGFAEFHFESSLETSTNLEPLKSEQKYLDSSLYLVPKLQLTPTWSLNALIEIDHQGTQDRKTTVERSELGGEYSAIPLNPYSLLTLRGALLVPLGEKQSTQNSMILGFRFGPVLKFDLASRGLFPLMGSFEITGSRVFYLYETALNGKSNNKYILKNELDLDFKLIKNLHFLTTFIYLSGWNYQNTLSNKFKFSEELSYELSSHFALGLGHSNAASALRANGQTSNVSIFDPNTSTLYTALTYLF